MKKLFLIAAIAASFSLILGTNSCKSDNSTPPNQQFAGTYLGNFTVNGTVAPGGVIITATSGSATGIIINQGNGIIFNGTCSGATFTVPQQSFMDNSGNSWFVNSGSGIMSGSTLTCAVSFTYNGSGLVLVNAVVSKQ